MAAQIQLSKGILGACISSLRSFHKPDNCLLWISGSIFQPQLTNRILGIHISQLCGTLPVFRGYRIITLCTRTCVQHLSQTVLQLIIMAFFLQPAKASKCFPEMLFSRLTIFGGTDTATIHLCQLIAGIRISLFCRVLIQEKCTSILLLHTLSAVIKSCQGILRILVVCICRLGEPFRRRFITLFCTKSSCMHFANPVLEIRTLFLLCSLFFGTKSCQRCPVPFLRCNHVNLPSQAIRKHSAQVIHRQCISGFRFL